MGNSARQFAHGDFGAPPAAHCSATCSSSRPGWPPSGARSTTTVLGRLDDLAAGCEVVAEQQRVVGEGVGQPWLDLSTAAPRRRLSAQRVEQGLRLRSVVPVAERSPRHIGQRQPVGRSQIGSAAPATGKPPVAGKGDAKRQPKRSLTLPNPTGAWSGCPSGCAAANAPHAAGVDGRTG